MQFLERRIERTRQRLHSVSRNHRVHTGEDALEFGDGAFEGKIIEFIEQDSDAMFEPPKPGLDRWNRRVVLVLADFRDRFIGIEIEVDVEAACEQIARR